MRLHPFSSECGCQACWHTVYVALVEFRDALMELSLALHDLQFECDVDRRKLCEQVVKDLMRDVSSDHFFRSSRDPSDSSE